MSRREALKKAAYAEFQRMKCERVRMKQGLAAYAEFQRMKCERVRMKQGLAAKGERLRRTPFDDLELTMDEFAAEVDAITSKTSTLPRAQREVVIWCMGKALADIRHD